MLNIEVIRFEAQDVITASVATPAAPVNPAPEAPACTHSTTVPGEHIHEVHGFHDNDRYCGECGAHVWCSFDGKVN